MLSHLVGTILLFWGPFYFDKDQCSIIEQIKVYSTIKKNPTPFTVYSHMAKWEGHNFNSQLKSFIQHGCMPIFFPMST